jgi:hypothetical protein
MLGILNTLIKTGLKVSFKLETLESLLCQKVTTSLNKYSSDIVIGNLIQTRYQELFIGTLIKQKKEVPNEKTNNHMVNINRVTRNPSSTHIEEDMVKMLLALMPSHT